MADCVICRQPIHDTAYVCSSDAGRLAKRLWMAADLAPDLDVALAKLARLGEPGPIPSGTPAALPFSIEASTDAATIRNTVSTWSRLVLEHRAPRPHLAGPDCWVCTHRSCRLVRYQATGAPAGLEPALRWLARQVDWLRHQPFGAEAFDELSHAAALVVRAVDRPGVRTRITVGPCPELVDGDACPGEVIAIVPARDDRPAVMRCSSCRTEWPTAQWARAGRRILARRKAVAGR